MFNGRVHVTTFHSNYLILIQEHDRNNLLVPKTPVEESLCKTVAVQTTLTGVELDGTLNGLRREKKFLQSKLSRRDQRIAKTVSLIKFLKQKSLLTDFGEEIIKSQLCTTLDEIQNSGRSKTNRRYSHEIK